MSCQNDRDALREKAATQRPRSAPPTETAAPAPAAGAPREAVVAAQLARCEGQKVALQQILAEPAMAGADSGPAVAVNGLAAPAPGGAPGRAAEPGPGADLRRAEERRRAAAETTEGLARLATPLAGARGLDAEALSQGSTTASARQDLKGGSATTGTAAVAGLLSAPHAEAGLHAGRTGPHALELGPRQASLPARRSRPAPSMPADSAAEAQAAQQAAQVFRSNAGQLKACYERGLKRNANLQFVSKVQVRLTIGPEGRSQAVRLSPRADAELEACIERLVTHWAFPRYRGTPVTLEIPLSLRAQGG